jgi:hypothetical protein
VEERKENENYVSGDIISETATFMHAPRWRLRPGTSPLAPNGLSDPYCFLITASKILPAIPAISTSAATIPAVANAMGEKYSY